jgi:hypothetical protein
MLSISPAAGRKQCILPDRRGQQQHHKRQNEAQRRQNGTDSPRSSCSAAHLPSCSLPKRPVPEGATRLHGSSMPEDLTGEACRQTGACDTRANCRNPGTMRGSKEGALRVLDDWRLKGDGGRPTLLTRTVARDAPHRLRLGNDSRMAYKSGVDASLNRKRRPSGLNRSRYARKVGAVIHGRTEGWSLRRRCRRNRHPHAVMTSPAAAARRQACLTLRA